MIQIKLTNRGWEIIRVLFNVQKEVTKNGRN